MKTKPPPEIHCLDCGSAGMAGARDDDGEIIILACPQCGLMTNGKDPCADYVRRALLRVGWKTEAP